MDRWKEQKDFCIIVLTVHYQLLAFRPIGKNIEFITVQRFLAVINNFLCRLNVEMKQKLKYIKNIDISILLIELLETARRKKTEVKKYE